MRRWPTADIAWLLVAFLVEVVSLALVAGTDVRARPRRHGVSPDDGEVTTA